MSSRRCVALFALLLVLVGGCSKSAAPAVGVGASAQAPAQKAATTLPPTSATSSKPAGRRIIRNASLSMTVAEPAAAQRKASAIVKKSGGYVANAASRRLGTSRDAPLHITLELRVPANHLDRALDKLEALATGIDGEQIESRDVTDEYIDLDARLHTQKALELQYLDILKNAAKVSDALEVQKQLASVRGEIEKLEGRKRVLESQITMSTVKLDIEQQRPLVSASIGDLSHSIKNAGADAVNVGATLVNGSIRLLGVLLPVFLLLGLPAVLMFRFLLRRARRRREAFSAG